MCCPLSMVLGGCCSRLIIAQLARLVSLFGVVGCLGISCGVGGLVIRSASLAPLNKSLIAYLFSRLIGLRRGFGTRSAQPLRRSVSVSCYWDMWHGSGVSKFVCFSFMSGVLKLVHFPELDKKTGTISAPVKTSQKLRFYFLKYCARCTPRV